ncbi:hypothetical protein GGX14DRAFT_360250 [Mycena pura]|uniref:DUF6570 domain-containing protein n=1 Tax=Mycena pura TaxID=153505 RepID=A0AAD6VJD3_9AGAR|nr:hypothetical protein GGX14DRAFT_360250 [Mycena pura]
MISRCRAKCFIIQLKEEDTGITLPTTQRGMKGHIIVYPQRPSTVAQLLPPALDEITSPICVLFVGAQPPTTDWLRQHAKPLTVRPAKVRKALQWLQKHNRLYKDIQINEEVLTSMNEHHVLPVQIEHIVPSAAEAAEARNSRYDTSQSNDIQPPSVSEASEFPWQNVVITDVDGNASSNELRSAAFRHVKRGGGYISIPHDPSPVNEFMNPNLFPLIYPTLFPYGIGGFQNEDKETPLSIQRHIHLGLTQIRPQ